MLDVFDSDRQSQWEKQVSTPRDGYDASLGAACKLVTEASQCFGCKGSISTGTPEMPETEDGTLYAANVPATGNKPLRADLSARLDRDVHLDNDVSCLALSGVRGDEFTQCLLVMGLILGTGVDGGLIFNGKSIAGKSYITGESGHIHLPVGALIMMRLGFPLRRYGCGQHGCIENYLSGRNFVWLYQHYYHQPLQTSKIVAFYGRGNEQARAYVERYLDLLAVCLRNILTTVGPDLAVIGDGLSNFPATTTQPVGRLLYHLLPVARVPRIEHAHHGDTGGMRDTASLRLAD